MSGSPFTSGGYFPSNSAPRIVAALDVAATLSNSVALPGFDRCQGILVYTSVFGRFTPVGEAGVTVDDCVSQRQALGGSVFALPAIQVAPASGSIKDLSATRAAFTVMLRIFGTVIGLQRCAPVGRVSRMRQLDAPISISSDYKFRVSAA